MGRINIFSHLQNFQLNQYLAGKLGTSIRVGFTAVARRLPIVLMALESVVILLSAGEQSKGKTRKKMVRHAGREKN